MKVLESKERAEIRGGTDPNSAGKTNRVRPQLAAQYNYRNVTLLSSEQLIYFVEFSSK